MLLAVLKIIGIILLIIIGVVIFILGIVLFTPIRYHFAGEYKQKFLADAQVKWWPILLKADVSVKDNKIQYIVKLFGGVVMTNTDAKLSWIGRRFFAQEQNDEQKCEEDDAFVSNDVEENGKTPEYFGETGNVTVLEKTDASEEQQQGAQVHHQEVKKKRRISITERIRTKIAGVRKRLKKLIEQLKKINHKKESLQKVFQSKRFEVAKRDALQYIKELFSIVKPKRLEGYIHFGLDNPADTGQLLGVLAFGLSVYGDFLQIQPDFEKACLDGELKGCGTIRLFAVVKLILKVIFNKNLIKVIKKVQTIIEA